MSYRRVRRGEPAFEMIAANKAAGIWVCDAADHNEPGGCSNPECFNNLEERTMRNKTTKFTLTEDHVKLLRMMYVQWQDDERGAPEIDPKRPYGNKAVAEDIHEILTGEDGVYLTPVRRTECLALHRGTAVALQIVLATGSFEPGEFELLEEYDARSWRRVS